ncbi:MAG: hypothetical protein ACK55I_34065, partial [bacterium]
PVPRALPRAHEDERRQRLVLGPEEGLGWQAERPEDPVDGPDARLQQDRPYDAGQGDRDGHRQEVGGAEQRHAARRPQHQQREPHRAADLERIDDQVEEQGDA